MINRVQLEYLESMFLKTFFSKRSNERIELLDKIKKGEFSLDERRLKSVNLELEAYNEVYEFNQSINYHNVDEFLEPRTKFEGVSDRCYNYLESVREKIFESLENLGYKPEDAFLQSVLERKLILNCVNNLLYLFQKDPMEVRISVADCDSRKLGYTIINKMVCTYNNEKIRLLNENTDLYETLRASEQLVKNTFPFIKIALLESLVEYEDD